MNKEKSAARKGPNKRPELETVKTSEQMQKGKRREGNQDSEEAQTEDKVGGGSRGSQGGGGGAVRRAY